MPPYAHNADLWLSWLATTSWAINLTVREEQDRQNISTAAQASAFELTMSACLCCGGAGQKKTLKYSRIDNTGEQWLIWIRFYVTLWNNYNRNGIGTWDRLSFPVHIHLQSIWNQTSQRSCLVLWTFCIWAFLSKQCAIPSGHCCVLKEQAAHSVVKASFVEQC